MNIIKKIEKKTLLNTMESITRVTWKLRSS